RGRVPSRRYAALRRGARARAQGGRRPQGRDRRGGRRRARAGVTLGLYGGSFDPPHRAHVALAKRAKEVLGLDRLVVLVSADPGHKRVETPVAARLELARAAFPDAAIATDKLGRDVVILDMQPVCTYTDYFVVVTGGNPRQTKGIWDEVHALLKRDHGLLPRSADGEREATWIVADYIDVVLHVFTP